MTFFLFFLLAEGLVLVESFKVKSPWKIGGMSTCWDPLSPKFLTRSLIPEHHALNLGEGNLALDGEAKGTSEPSTNTLMRFPLLKANDAMLQVGLEWRNVLVRLGQNQIGGQTFEGCRLGFQSHPKNVPEYGR